MHLVWFVEIALLDWAMFDSLLQGPAILGEKLDHSGQSGFSRFLSSRILLPIDRQVWVFETCRGRSFFRRITGKDKMVLVNAKEKNRLVRNFLYLEGHINSFVENQLKNASKLAAALKDTNAVL
jgi:hypothetical protein